MSIGIYKIENLLNHKIYIGQSKHIEKRFLEHCKLSAKSLVGKAISKYGKENFSFEILEECNESELDEKEELYIKQYNCLVPQGYNITLPDGQNKQVFSHYSLETLQNIINDIKNSNLSFQQIADKYKLDVSMIYYLNRGNYHTQTNEQYPLRPVKDFSKKITLCIDCDKPISYGSKRCEECAKIAQRTVARPSREEFKDLIRKCSFVELGKQYNVSDKAIVKWCKFYNLPFRKKDIKQYSDEQWEEL